jgi:hypothetical protein
VISHKGDWSRVNDHKSYQDNYETIFRRKEDKGQEAVLLCAETSQANGEADNDLQANRTDGAELRQD